MSKKIYWQDILNVCVCVWHVCHVHVLCSQFDCIKMACLRHTTRSYNNAMKINDSIDILHWFCVTKMCMCHSISSEIWMLFIKIEAVWKSIRTKKYHKRMFRVLAISHRYTKCVVICYMEIHWYRMLSMFFFVCAYDDQWGTIQFIPVCLYNRSVCCSCWWRPRR